MITRKARLWLGLGAFVMVAHAPGLAAASGTTVAVQGTAQRVAQNTEPPPSDCAEESACASGTAGGEGEGGQAKAAADPVTDDLAYLHQLGILRGQLEVGMDLYRRGDMAAAREHMEYPADELYADLRPALEARDAPDLTQLVQQLATSVREVSPSAQVEADYAAMADGLDQAERAAAGARQPLVVLGAIQRLVKSAAVEYGEAVMDGQVVKPREYQDSLGFVRVARAMLARLGGAEDANQKVVIKVEQALSGLDPAWPDIEPPDHVITDPNLLYGAAAKIETALLSVKS
jgi:hypothetical protein